jgi:Acetyltransferase (GNAT) domain
MTNSIQVVIMNKITIKHLNKIEFEERIPQFIDLFRNAFNRDISKEFLQWRYLENPIEDLLVCVAINEKDEVIANYSASPCEIHFNDKLHKAAISMTTMTHKDYAGRGLFTTLATSLYTLMETRDYLMIYGFPNNNSHYGFINKLDWKDIYEIPSMKLKLSTLNPKINLVEPIVQEDNNFSLDYRKLNRLNPSLKIYKDSRYLNWRFQQNPSHDYINYIISYDNQNINAFCTVKNYNDDLDIVEFHADSIENGKSLLNFIILLAKDSGINTVNTWVSLHSKFRTIFEKVGFLNDAPITYFGGKVLNERHLNSLQVNNYRNWEIHMGDSDVY